MAAVNARAIGRRTARGNIMDLNQNEFSHRANHLHSNNVHDHPPSKHHTAKPNGGTAADSAATTFRPLEPRRDPPVRLPQPNAAKKSITSEIVKLPERTSLLSGGK